MNKHVLPGFCRVGSVFFILFGLNAMLYAQSAEERIKSIIEKHYKQDIFPGLVVSYVSSSGFVASVAHGYADVESSSLMKKTTRMPGGSTGKTFVMASVMQLIEEGKLGLDDRISKWFEKEVWFANLPNSRAITVRNLLQHTSGIQRYEFKPSFVKQASKNPDKLWKPEELISFVLNDQPLFESGNGFSYADTNYILLGMIIERIQDQSFYEFVDTRFIKPLNLISVEAQQNRKYKGLAAGYSDEQDPLGFSGKSLDDKGNFKYNVQFEWTGGGFIFNVADYAQWLKHVYEGKVFSKALLEEALKGVDAKEVGGLYGLGTQIMHVNNHTFIGHSGFFPGYLTIGLYNQSNGTVLAMQANSTKNVSIKPFFDLYFELLKELN